jgi:hypothetical protein
MKAFLQTVIIRFFCRHSVVSTTKGASYKGSLKDRHRVTCLLCDYTFSKTGQEIRDTWSRERSCTCVFEKG